MIGLPLNLDGSESPAHPIGPRLRPQPRAARPADPALGRALVDPGGHPHPDRRRRQPRPPRRAGRQDGRRLHPPGRDRRACHGPGLIFARSDFRIGAFGKGETQNEKPLSDGAAVRVVPDRRLQPAGRDQRQHRLPGRQHRRGGAAAPAAPAGPPPPRPAPPSRISRSSTAPRRRCLPCTSRRSTTAIGGRIFWAFDNRAGRLRPGLVRRAPKRSAIGTSRPSSPIRQTSELRNVNLCEVGTVNLTGN